MVVIVLAIGLLLGLIGFLSDFDFNSLIPDLPNGTGNGDGGGVSSSPVSYSLAMNGEVITESGRAAGILVIPGVGLRFDIVTDGAEIGEYTVKIVPNAKAESFEFYLGGQACLFSYTDDFTDSFNIDEQSDYFVIAPPIGGVLAVLSGVYGTGVTIMGDIPAGDLFAVVVTFNDGTVIVVDFGIAIVPDRIDLDRGVIVF
jgi:hypothetical protein